MAIQPAMTYEDESDEARTVYSIACTSNGEAGWVS